LAEKGHLTSTGVLKPSHYTYYSDVPLECPLACGTYIWSRTLSMRSWICDSFVNHITKPRLEHLSNLLLYLLLIETHLHSHQLFALFRTNVLTTYGSNGIVIRIRGRILPLKQKISSSNIRKPFVIYDFATAPI
jgi:hypothetical protein